MRELVKDLINARISRRGFLSGMAAASYSMAAAKSAMAAVEPFIPGGELPKEYVRTITGTGGDLMLEQMVETGTPYLFCSNGSGLGPIVDALVSRPQIQLIQATQEGQVVAMADGYAKVTGKPSFGFYSRVGLPHSTSNMYNSMKDRTPLVIMSDHADSTAEGTDSHEDIDNWEEAARFYTKWTWTANQPERLAEWVRKAYKVASVLPGGPTYIRTPRDLMYKEVTAAVYSREALNVPMSIRPDADEVVRAAKVLLSAQSPLMEVGPEVGHCNARAALVELCELLAIPVIQYRSITVDFPNTHPLWVGEDDQVAGYLQRNPKPIDLYINFGARTRRNGYGGRNNAVREIHASVDENTIGRNAPMVAALVGNLAEVAKDLVAAVNSLATPAQLKKLTEERRHILAGHTKGVMEARLAAGRMSKGSPVPWPALVYELRQQMEKDAVIVAEQGTEYKTLGMFPFADDAMLKVGRTEGRALGWGTGASVGVKLALPNRQVLSFQGDGGFLFGQTDSLWTMSRYDIPVMTVIFNNHSYEETRWQMMGHNGPAGQANRDYISYLGNPVVDFTKLAAAYNIPGAVVTNTDQLKDAIRTGLRTLAEGRPFMLDVHTRRIGIGAEVTNHQKFSLAEKRERKV
jgi:thiamine pyrophosphate-dependent acetolactate synthase large subunit-like protein